jgi:hypothetical protein
MCAYIYYLMSHCYCHSIVCSALFVYLAIDGYYDIRREKFLALSQGDGICEEIPKDVTGVFLADSNGNWQGDEGFEFSQALYRFTFFHLETSEDNFHYVIESYLSRLDVLGDLMKTENLATTVLFWTTWMINSGDSTFNEQSSQSEEGDVRSSNSFSDDNNAHYFTLTGKESVIIYYILLVHFSWTVLLFLVHRYNIHRPIIHVFVFIVSRHQGISKQ